MTSSGVLARSRKPRLRQEWLCERVFRPVANVVVLALLPLRVPPPVVVLASTASGLAGAVELARGHLVVAAVLVQAKTVFDNADGQLARAAGRITLLGRYLDAECDLLVDAALFAGLGWYAHAPALAAIGFLALTAILSINFNLERLARGAGLDAPPARGVTAAFQRLYAVLYGWQDRLVERFVAWRLDNASVERRRTYHDETTVAVLANIGMSTQLATFGAFLALGRPLAYVWVLVAELALVAALVARREHAFTQLEPGRDLA